MVFDRWTSKSHLAIDRELFFLAVQKVNSRECENATVRDLIAQRVLTLSVHYTRLLTLTVTTAR